MAKKRTDNEPLTHAERSKIDEELARQGLQPWLPISPDRLPERLRKKPARAPKPPKTTFFPAAGEQEQPARPTRKRRGGT